VQVRKLKVSGGRLRGSIALALLAFLSAACETTTTGGSSLEDAAAALDREDYATARPMLLELSDAGYFWAMFELGKMSENGQGVARDDAEALKWYRAAATAGYDLAQYKLGLIFEDGIHAPQDYAEARKWYSVSANQGFAPAEYNFGVLYYYGRGGAQDYTEAARWFRSAAEHALPTAETALAEAYREGRGVPRDAEKAEQWKDRAGMQGYAPAFYTTESGPPVPARISIFGPEAAENVCGIAIGAIGVPIALSASDLAYRLLAVNESDLTNISRNMPSALLRRKVREDRSVEILIAQQLSLDMHSAGYPTQLYNFVQRKWQITGGFFEAGRVVYMYNADRLYPDILSSYEMPRYAWVPKYDFSRHANKVCENRDPNWKDPMVEIP